MTSWLPDLSAFPGPRYRAISEALAADIARSVLPPGTRLPTQRDLAWRLGVTVGTVSRAYAEAERRGLIGGEVGRGTYVRTPAKLTVPAPSPYPAEAADIIEFGLNLPFGGDETAAIAATLARLAGSAEVGAVLGYRSDAERLADASAGADWLRR